MQCAVHHVKFHPSRSVTSTVSGDVPLTSIDTQILFSRALEPRLDARDISFDLVMPVMLETPFGQKTMRYTKKNVESSEPTIRYSFQNLQERQ